jgi:phosphoglycerate dehydrogenase-like enzyme
MKIYFNTKAFDCLPEKSKIDITENIRDAELLVLGAKSEKYDELKKLRAIYRFGVGRENISDELLKQGVPKVYFPSERTRNALFESTADFTAYLILSMYYRRSEGEIEKWEKCTRKSIANTTLLVIGLGNIGKRVAEKMRSFMKITAYDILLNQPGELRPLIEQADIISVHMPSTEQTKDFFDETKLAWVKNDAILINTARGSLFNEEALYKKIAASGVRAAFDVFWKEPYRGILKELGPEKFRMTPHTASQTIEYVKEGFNDILNIINLHKGEKDE